MSDGRFKPSIAHINRVIWFEGEKIKISNTFNCEKTPVLIIGDWFSPFLNLLLAYVSSSAINDQNSIT